MDYSCFNILAGFINAVLIACELTVQKAMSKANTDVQRNIFQSMEVRQEKLTSLNTQLFPYTSYFAIPVPPKYRL